MEDVDKIYTDALRIGLNSHLRTEREHRNMVNSVIKRLKLIHLAKGPAFLPTEITLYFHSSQNDPTAISNGLASLVHDYYSVASDMDPGYQTRRNRMAAKCALFAAGALAAWKSGEHALLSSQTSKDPAIVSGRVPSTRADYDAQEDYRKAMNLVGKQQEAMLTYTYVKAIHTAVSRKQTALPILWVDPDSQLPWCFDRSKISTILWLPDALKEDLQLSLDNLNLDSSEMITFARQMVSDSLKTYPRLASMSVNDREKFSPLFKVRQSAMSPSLERSADTAEQASNVATESGQSKYLAEMNRGQLTDVDDTRARELESLFAGLDQEMQDADDERRFESLFDDVEGTFRPEDEDRCELPELGF